jgi:HD superfamily phosphohydrolase
MLKSRDRLYGQLELPDLAWEVAMTCPVILRLREIRMANIPFLTHPSFANVDRYEHSLGVAHLAWRWARRCRIPNDQALALTLAALYHDGATPAFGHLLEEYLRRFGFDHEMALVDVLQGTSRELPGSENVQVFLGRHCKLRSVLPRPTSAGSYLTAFAVADLAAGHGELGRLIKGDLDFDNVDNVIRAATAMGLVQGLKPVHPYDIIDALVLEDNSVRIDHRKGFPIAVWSEVRRVLYERILNNAYEFRAQAAMKWAIEDCAASDPVLRTKAAWVLTDPELTFEHLRRVPFSRLLVDRLRLGGPPELLFSAWVDDLSPLTDDRTGVLTTELCNDLSELTNTEVYVNHYVDKRLRRISGPPATQPALFDALAPAGAPNKSRWLTGSQAGILGAIYVSRTEKLAPTADPPHRGSLSKRAARLDDMESILRRHLGRAPVAVSTGWVGTAPRPTQSECSLTTHDHDQA